MTVHDPLASISSRITPQSEPIPGTTQVRNSAGGYVFEVDRWMRLQRFLILGTDGGTYYTSERDLTAQNVGLVRAALDADPRRTVDLIVDISTAGRAPKPKQAIFALALAAAHPEAKAYALAALPKVCRTGTHLFQFIAYVEKHRGWGRALKRGVGAWFTEKDADQLAYQLVKYKSRDGWSMRDILRLAKPTPERESATDLAIRWAVGKPVVEVFGHDHEDSARLPRVIVDHLAALQASTPAEAARLISAPGSSLSWEMLNSEHLRSPEVWKAFIPNMGVTALIRNLARFSNLHMFEDPTTIMAVVNRLTDAEQLRRARIHPLQVLFALDTYQQGRGDKGKMTWTPNPRIIDALNEAFHKSFVAVEPANARTLIGLDISGSMETGRIAGTQLSCSTASAAMALVTLKTEPVCHVIAFDNAPGCFTFSDEFRSKNYGPLPGQGRYYRSGGARPVDMSGAQRVTDVIHARGRWTGGGGTDCALPMAYALATGMSVDHFVIYTDNETWAGVIHPAQMLKMYRERTGINAKLTVVGMTATPFTIADPSDSGMLDVVGFDAAAPALIADFAAGRI